MSLIAFQAFVYITAVAVTGFAHDLADRRGV